MTSQNDIFAATSTPTDFHTEESSSSSSGPGPSTAPTFGSNQNIPFSFRPAQVLPEFPQSPKGRQAWSPPSNFSAEKAFPIPATNHDQGNVPAEPGIPQVGRRRRPITLAAMRRLFGQRQNQLVRSQDRADGGDLGNRDGAGGSSRTARATPNQFILNLPRPAYHIDLPFVLKGHLQFGFAFCLRALFLYVVTRLIVAVQRDVSERMSENSLDVTQEIALCAFQYQNNLCDTSLVPAMVRQCSSWETCMNRNPAVVGRTKVGAELIGEAFNSLVEPISWKTMIFVLITLPCYALFRSILARRQRHSTPDGYSHDVPPQDYRRFVPAFLPAGSHQMSDGNAVNPTRRRRLDSVDETYR